MFRDEAKIYVKGGDGGHGCLSFRREIYIPKGGPDGGDGGRGGHVVLLASQHENTLLSLVRNPHQRAKAGVSGMGSNKHGARGADCVVRVPLGTIVKDANSGVVLKDLNEVGMTAIVARGGRGGRGNARFKSSVNQTPRRADKGRPGQERTLRLELKLIADVGLVGLPNAGKSTLVAAVSAARPKIADYPFTTLEPHPGIVELSGWRRFVMMDIPGLIEGASEGHGLGDRFLRHIERTQVLVHMIDLSAHEDLDAVEADYRTILTEIEACGRGLAERPRLVAWSKIDSVPDHAERVAELERRLDLSGSFAFSAMSRQGLPQLLEACFARVAESRGAEEQDEGPQALPVLDDEVILASLAEEPGYDEGADAEEDAAEDADTNRSGPGSGTPDAST